MESALRRWAVAPLIIGVAALGAAACGGSTPTPAPSSAPPTTSASANAHTLANAVLQVSDFTPGATTGDVSKVPSLTDIKCTPDQASGVQRQYKSDIRAASGREYGNVVVAFDTASDAHAFIDAFYKAAQSCSSASSASVQDNFSTASFYFTIAGSPNDLRVEAVQVDRYVTVLIQYVPQGKQADQQSLRDLTQASVNKLQTVSA